MSCIYVGDEGTVFRVQMLDCDTGAVIDVSAVTTKEIIFKDPLDVVVAHPAAFFTDGTDGILDYTVVTGDLAISGTWEIQAHVEATGFINTSSTSTFTVSDVLQ